MPTDPIADPAHAVLAALPAARPEAHPDVLPDAPTDAPIDAATDASTRAPTKAAPKAASEAPGGTVPAAVPRVVLDSNIWVDLLVFRDPHVEPIRAALAAGTIAPVIRADCREELRRVLAYPQFARFAVDIGAALAEVDRVSTLVAAPLRGASAGESADGSAGESAGESADGIRLPRCRDTDDQKFIELAHDARAALLVSKDKAVLKLRSRLRRTSGVDILPPRAFGAWLAAWQPQRSPLE